MHVSSANIYNGNIFPSLNPAKIFQFISQWTESTKSSAVGPNHRAVINTSNEVKSPLLWEFWIYNFSLSILERVLRWRHCKYKEWVSFFLGSWGMNRSAEQTNRPRTASRFTRFVCPALRFIPHEPRKKDTHSLKNSYVWLPRKYNYRTHRQTDAGQSDPYVPLCFAGDTIHLLCICMYFYKISILCISFI